MKFHQFEHDIVIRCFNATYFLFFFFIFEYGLSIGVYWGYSITCFVQGKTSKAYEPVYSDENARYCILLLCEFLYLQGHPVNAYIDTNIIHVHILCTLSAYKIYTRI